MKILNPLFKFLRLQFVTETNWYNRVGWKMVKHIDCEVKKTTTIIIHNVNFVSFTCDEVTSMDNAS